MKRRIRWAIDEALHPVWAWLIARYTTAYWGKRCGDYQEGCPACDAWEAYDTLMGD